MIIKKTDVSPKKYVGNEKENFEVDYDIENVRKIPVEIKTFWKKASFSVEYYSNGDKYEGYMLKRQRHGVGFYYYKDGSRYEGDWKYNVKDGLGTYYYANGDKYDGEYKNNVKEVWSMEKR